MSLFEAPSFLLLDMNYVPDWGPFISINLNCVPDWGLWFKLCLICHGQTIMFFENDLKHWEICFGYVPDWCPFTSINLKYVPDWGPFTSINLNYVPDWGPFTSIIKSELCTWCPIIWIMSDWDSFTSIIKHEFSPANSCPCHQATSYYVVLHHIMSYCVMYQLGLFTGSRFIVIPVNRHRYQNRYGHSYSFDIHFDMF